MTTITAGTPIPKTGDFEFLSSTGGPLRVRRVGTGKLVALSAPAAIWNPVTLIEASEFLKALAVDMDPSLGEVPEVAPPASTERTKPTPQALKVLDYLRRHDSISQLVATEEIGTTRLAARIRELRVAGHKISREIKRSDRGKTYGSYRLVREAEAA